MSDLQILADENIPCVEAAFGQFGRVRSVRGDDIGPSALHGIDVLLVRSVTSVGVDLLAESSVRFVGSATTGMDHVDTGYLQDANVAFAHAPGANADSVADYVVVSLLSLARRHGRPLSGRTAGIVGHGNIGSRVARRLSALGMTVLLNDPPKAQAGEGDGRGSDYVSLEHLVEASDVVSLHVPLKRDGPHPTHHLIDRELLGRVGGGAWIVNTSRGPVVDGEALRAARMGGNVGALVLDVWENEPAPDPALIRAADLATPHIAGYAHDGKVRGTAMLYEALCAHLGTEPTWEGTRGISAESPDALRCRPPDPRLPPTEWLTSLARQAYDVGADDRAMRSIAPLSVDERAEAFTLLRKQYPKRRELQSHTVPSAAVTQAYRRAVQEGLTISLREPGPSRATYESYP